MPAARFMATFGAKPQVYMTILRKILFLFFFFAVSQSALAQLYLNEVCSANDVSVVTENGDTPDWIELYNDSDFAVNLADYFLSDDFDEPKKWSFPAAFLPPQSYLVVFASGDDELTDGEIHTNFKLAKEGENLVLSDPQGAVLQRLRIPPLDTDLSYARLPSGEYFYTTQPTPEAENMTSGQIFRAANPVFSQTGLLQNETFNLILTAPDATAQIRYTLDGSTPDIDDFSYNSPLSISENTVVRARAFLPNGLPSETISHSFLFNTEHDLPIISVMTEPAALFDPITGLFEKGPGAEPDFPFWGANFWSDRKVPVAVEMYDPLTEDFATFDVALETHGGRGTRTNPQKAARLKAEPEFGSEAMIFPFFPERENTDFSRIVLRNAGGDFNYAHCRDEFLARYYLRENLDVDVLAYQPAAWYINGAYYGIIALREKGDEYWMRQNYDIPLTDLDLLEEETLVLRGTRDKFAADLAFALENDLSDDVLYAEAAARFDVENIADYWIAQTAVNNANWPKGNIKYWRERSPSGRWRYLLFDSDVAMERHPWTSADKDLLNDRLEDEEPVLHSDLMNALLENENYRRYFINRYADLLNSTFREENWHAAVAAHEAEVDAEMQRHFGRWSGCEDCYSYAHWRDTAMVEMKNYTLQRPALARDYVQSQFDLQRQVTLDLRTYPAEAGDISVNTLDAVNLPWEGKYFAGVPVTLTVTPRPGFTFSHWASVENVQEPLRRQSITVDFAESDGITAYFTADYAGLEAEISPNPTHDRAVLTFTIDRTKAVEVLLTDAAGRSLQTLVDKQLSGGTHQIPVSAAHLKSGTYFVRLRVENQTQTLNFVKI